MLSFEIESVFKSEDMRLGSLEWRGGRIDVNQSFFSYTVRGQIFNALLFSEDRKIVMT